MLPRAHQNQQQGQGFRHGHMAHGQAELLQDPPVQAAGELKDPSGHLESPCVPTNGVVGHSAIIFVFKIDWQVRIAMKTEDEVGFDMFDFIP